ncbi:hypothetical protein Tco_0871207 [Tanacetum coccineum]
MFQGIVDIVVIEGLLMRRDIDETGHVTYCSTNCEFSWNVRAIVTLIFLLSLTTCESEHRTSQKHFDVVPNCFCFNVVIDELVDIFGKSLKHNIGGTDICIVSFLSCHLRTLDTERNGIWLQAKRNGGLEQNAVMLKQNAMMNEFFCQCSNFFVKKQYGLQAKAMEFLRRYAVMVEQIRPVISLIEAKRNEGLEAKTHNAPEHIILQRPNLRVLQIGIRAKVIENQVMATPTIPVFAEENLGDPIDIRMDIIHPEPVAVVYIPATAIVRTQAQHGEAIRGIQEHLLGMPIQEELTALRFRVDIAEAENASLRAGIKNMEAIGKITRNRERQARIKIGQQLAAVQESQRQDREDFKKLKELVIGQFGQHS